MSQTPRLSVRALLLALPAILLLSTAASAQSSPTPGTAAGGAKSHKVAIQVNDNDPRIMNLALNNVANLTAYYKAKGEAVVIQVVTYGPGLHMLRADTSPVKGRIAEMSLAMPHVSFSACQNTRDNMSKAESKPIDIVSEAKSVPSGVVTLIELQEKGFAYIRP